MIRKVISDLLDEWAPKGEFDFADFASMFPVAVMCGVLGVSAEPVRGLCAALDAQISSLAFLPELRSQILEGFDALWDFADEIVSERERESLGKVGLLEALIEAKNAGNLSDEEVRTWVILLLVAGYDTTKNQLCMTMHMMLDRPEMWKRCAEDKEFCANVVDEMFRHSAIASWTRTVAEDLDYEGVRLPKGAMLVFAPSLAGRDPAMFEDPMTFDPDRPDRRRHLGFGRGAHTCIGQWIAKYQLEEGLHLIAQRIRNPRLVGEVSWRPFLGAWGPKSLPIAFEPGEFRSPEAAASGAA